MLMGTFSPKSIYGLQLWLDASDTSTITSSSGRVSQWNDKSGNGWNATQGTGAAQLSTGVIRINNQNTLSSASGTRYMTVSSYNLDPSQGISYYFVGYQSAAAIGNIMSQDNGVGTGRTIFFYNTAVNDYRSVINGTLVTVGAGLGLSNPIILSARYNNITGYLMCYANTTATYNSNAGSVSSANGFLLIGVNKILTEPIVGSIADIAIYNRNTSLQEHNALIKYFKAKWGIA